MSATALTHQRSFGAAYQGNGRTVFRFWAPDRDQVLLEIAGQDALVMEAQMEGWFSIETAAMPGAAYKFRVSADLAVPDPASDWQEDDVHGASVVVDHAAYRWRSTEWRGRPWHEAVIYELHVGLLGGFKAVMAQLPHLAELGVTVIELMPIADFPGKRNWGYDGVLLYAPDSAYGSPDELKALVDTAHELGLMVMLDVVYNHFGPDGNYIPAYASGFYQRDRATPWGDAIDFRETHVRRFFIENALHWLETYRFDGLRFDAVHAIADSAFLTEMAGEIRGRTAVGRHVHLVLENEDNDASLLRLAADGSGFDAQWADDLHHCLHVMLTGEAEAYYEDYSEQPSAHLARCLLEGFAFQGETSVHTATRRGTPSAHLPPTCFVICLQNHDQVGNRAFGERVDRLTKPEALKAATALLLLTPQIPLLFMGQEWASSAPFLYFASHTGELAEAVRNGRRQEFARFSAFANPNYREEIPDPNHPGSFATSRPEPVEAQSGDHAQWMAFHRRLLQIRATEIMPRMPGCQALDAVVIGRLAVRARWRMGDGSVLLISLNLHDESVECAVSPGRVLFQTAPRSSDGWLPGYGTDVVLETGSDA